MEVSVCFLCLKRIESYSGGDGSYSSDIHSKFWKFVKQYLPPPPPCEGGGDEEDEGERHQLLIHMRAMAIGAGAKNGKQSFCKDCEVVVSSVCKLYSKLVTAQLHLAWKLGEVGRMLKTSKGKVSSKLGKMLIKSLAEQMGLGKVNRVDKLRSWLMETCEQKRQESLPYVRVERSRKLLPKKVGIVMKPNLLKELSSVDDDVSGTLHKDIIKIEVDEPDPMLTGDHKDQVGIGNTEWISDGPVDSFSLQGSNDGFDDNGSPAYFSHDEITNEEQVPDVPQKLKEEPIENHKISMIKEFSKSHRVCDKNEDEESERDLDDVPPTKSRPRRKRTRKAVIEEKEQDQDDDSTFEPDSSAEESSDQISSASDSEWSSPPPEKKTKKIISTVAKRGRGRPRKYPQTPPKPKAKPKPKLNREKVDNDRDNDRDNEEDQDQELGCPQCDKKLANNHRLLSHIRFVHNPIICNLCQKTFIGQHALRDHAAEEHQGEGNFTCPTCCRPFPSYYSMSRHMRRIHHDRRYTCSECGVTVKTSRSLRLHTNAVHNPTPITCQHCGKVSTCLKYHREHISQHHPETKEEGGAEPAEKKYICPICTKAGFYRKLHLDRHLVTCGIKKGARRKPKPKTSKKSDSDGQPQSYFCHFCGKEFRGKKKTYYRSHLLTHSNLDEKEATFQCPKCTTAFHFRHQLTQHVRRVHNTPKKGRPDIRPKLHLKCMFPSCGMRFPKGNGRKEHIAQSHADIKESGGAAGYLCEDCGRLFRPEYKQRYEIHVEAHFGAKPFQCPHCPSTFSYTRNFDEHMKDYHSGEGKEKVGVIDCTQEGCDRKFKVQSKLKKHLREDHGIRRPIGVRAMRRLLKAESGAPPPKKDEKGEKPKQMYLCHTCGKGFSGREYYKAHLLKHNEDDAPSIQCDQCPSTFHAMIQLKQHIRRNHRGLRKGRKIIPKEVMLQCLFPPVEEVVVSQKVEQVDNQEDKTGSFQPLFYENL